MNYNDRYIMELAKTSIFNIKPKNPEGDIDWKYIFDKSCEQNVTGLLFCAVSKINREYLPSADLMQKWNDIMLGTIGVTNNRYNEFLRMYRIVISKGIKFVGLKGCILRNIYPVPELRTMGDFDIITSKDTLSELEEIFKQNDYDVKKEAFGIVCKNDRGYWEIFTTVEKEFRTKYEKLDDIFINNIVSEKGLYFPEYTYFLSHLIIHTGKHYIREGAGIRNLCDIALFINRYKNNIDFDVVKKICIEQNYGNMYEYIINTVKKWFDVDIEGINIEEKNCDRFVEYMLLNGVFGKHNNTVVSQVAKHEDDSIGGLRKILFPTVKMLDYRYKYLKKAPILLPVAWIHRVFSALFRLKYSFRQMAGDMKEAVEFSDERNKWLKELGLFDEH